MLYDASWFEGRPSFEVAYPFARLFGRPFDLEHRKFELSEPSVSLRPEYGKLVVRVAQALPTLSALIVGLGDILGGRKSDGAMKEVWRAAVRRGGACSQVKAELEHGQRVHMYDSYESYITWVVYA